MLETLIAHHRKLLANAQKVLDENPALIQPALRDAALLSASTHRAYVAILEQASVELDGAYPKWRHVKRGTVYNEVGAVMIQCDFEVHDEDVLTLYRDVRTGAWFARRPEEFQDGRFVGVDDASAEAPLPEAADNDVIVILKGGCDPVEWRFSQDAWGKLIFHDRGRFEITAGCSADQDLIGFWLIDSTETVDGHIYANVRRAPEGV